MPDLDRLAAATIDIYDRQGARFDAERPKGLHERIWLDRFVAELPAGAHVLDAGCGAGEPFVGYFLSRGMTVTGLDASATMIGLVRTRFPDLDWHHADMTAFDLGRTFDGILAWNSFFHLAPGDQHKALACFAAHLAPGGALMLTVGPDAGEAQGVVGGEPVYHASLSPAGYAAALESNGLVLRTFVAEDRDCDMQSVLIARKAGGRRR